MDSAVFIIIPAFNEGNVLRNTVQELLPSGAQVVVVDDGSDASPWPLLQDLPIHFLRHPVNLGQGAALQTGMDYARRLGANAVIHFDADGQHDASAIPEMLAALASADLVLGSRFLREEDARQIPAGRRMLLRLARVINFLFTGVWLTDAHNGFRALNRHALETIRLSENRMAHATEILSRARQAKLRIREVPVSIRYTDYSRGKGQKWYQSLNILIDLILNKFM